MIKFAPILARQPFWFPSPKQTQKKENINIFIEVAGMRSENKHNI